MSEPNVQQLIDQLPLIEHHVEDLARSGITREQALAAGIRSVSVPETISALLNWKSPATALGPCLMFTFRDAAGTLIGDYARLKPDKPRIAKKGDNNGKPIKYESPRGKANRAYFPIGISPALSEPSTALIITEGEKKSLKSTLDGFPIIGLVGIWGWITKRERDKDGKGVGERKLIPELATVSWHGRSVYIAFDSDAAHKQEIQLAERYLAETLLAAGTREVKIVRLPDMPDGNKCGLDDFLVANRADKLHKLIDGTAIFTGAPGQPGNDNAIIIGTDEHRVNRKAAAALANDPDIYQTGNQLVRILQGAEQDDDEREIRRPAGPRIDPMPLPSLRDRLTAVAQFQNVKESDGGIEYVPAHPPAWCVAAVAARGQWPGVRPLDGVVSFPILRRDGSILATPGYDRTSRLYLDWPHAPLPLIGTPTRKDAISAADALIDVVSDFPFQSPIHRAVWLAGLLTPLARNVIDGPAPLFLVDANVRAAGKGKLLDTLAIIVLGTRMVVATYPRDEDELRKKITACIVRGDRLVLLDNLTGPFGNGTLDALLTGTTWRDRILGESRMYDGPALATWYATGNNVCIGADTGRRVDHIRLESDLERPEKRAGFRHPDLLAFVARHRLRLLAAALTILRAYIIAGKPDMKLKPWGSYEAWSGIIRNAIVWIDLPDPGETRLMVQEQADTTATTMRALLAALEMIDPKRVGLTAAEIVRLAGDAEDAGDARHSSEVREMLRDSIAELFDKPDARKLSYRLRSIKRRILDGRYLDEASETRTGVIRWAVFPSTQFAGGQEPSPASSASPAYGGSPVQGMPTMQGIPGTPNESPTGWDYDPTTDASRM